MFKNLDEVTKTMVPDLMTTINSNPAVAKRFIGAIDKLYAFSKRHPEELHISGPRTGPGEFDVMFVVMRKR